MPDFMKVTQVLVVSPFEEDHEALPRILRDPQWAVSSARSLLEAWITLHRTKIDVVLAECEFENGLSWRELLEEISEMRHPQPVIIASSQADNRLWTVSVRATAGLTGATGAASGATGSGRSRLRG